MLALSFLRTASLDLIKETNIEALSNSRDLRRLIRRKIIKIAKIEES